VSKTKNPTLKPIRPGSWYNDHKNDFLLWDDEINPVNSFVQAFVKYFATSERKYQWQVDSDRQLPMTYVVKMFLEGLHGKTAALISVEDFETLDDAIVKAQKIQAKTYYKNKDNLANLDKPTKVVFYATIVVKEAISLETAIPNDVKPLERPLKVKKKGSFRAKSGTSTNQTVSIDKIIQEQTQTPTQTEIAKRPRYIQELSTIDL
ncbi:20880_t:CDS:2, partial [Racocetra persica]